MTTTDSHAEPSSGSPPPPPSRTRRASLAVLTNLLQQFSRLLAHFFVTPFLVRGLGDELYGAWRLIQETIGYLSIGMVGATSALKWTLATAISASDVEIKRRQIASTVVVAFRMGGLLLIACAGLVVASPWIIRVDPVHQTAVIVASALVALDLVSSPAVSMPAAILRGTNLEYRAMWLRALVWAAPPVLSAAGLAMGWGLVGVAGGALAGSLVVGATLWIIARRALPWLGLSRPQKGETRRMQGLSLWLLLWMLVWQLLGRSDVVIIGLVISPAAVTTYVLTRFLFSAMQGPLFAVFGAIMPGVGDLIGQGRWDRVASVRRQGLSLVWLLITAAGTMTILFNRPLMTLWVGAGHYAGDFVNAGLAVAGMLLVLLRFDANLIDATLDVARKTLSGLAVGGLTVLLGVIGTSMWGFEGAVGAICIARALLAWIYSALMRRKLPSTDRGRLAGLRAPVVSAALLFAAAPLAPMVPLGGWPGVILGAGTSALVTAVAFWWLGMPRSERSALRERMEILVAQRRSRSG